MGFSKKTLDFLIENKLQNSKTWYEEHKQEYREHVLEPMQSLVSELAPFMLEIDQGFIIEPKVDKTISKIYRDTRFSKDKSLYRDNCWLTFMREKKLYLGMPAYFFAVNPFGLTYGMGYYEASPATMTAIRTMALNLDPYFKKAWKAYKSQSVFKLAGDKYKKTKFPDQSEEMRDFLDRKSVSFICESDEFELLFSGKAAEKLRTDFKQIEPIYKFFSEAEKRKQVGN